MMPNTYDAILFVAFGGPEGPDDVMPFLENVLRGKNVPRERMLAVAEHYHHFGGVSPINGQVRELLAAVELPLRRRGIELPIYWGNRNWHPLLANTVAKMRDNGVRRALAFVLAAYSSYSSCRQYRENLADAQATAGPTSPAIDKVRVFYNHPDFIAANVDRLRMAMQSIPAARRDVAHVAFTAHSIPQAMADACPYEQQLLETCRLITEQLEIQPSRYRLLYQSRSGRPQDPWLGPDIVDHLRDLKQSGVSDVVVAPVGFLSDHVEVLYDLDTEAKQAAEELGLGFVRAASVGTHPRFVEMIVKLIAERLDQQQPREAIGNYQPNWDVCPEDCCLQGRDQGQPARRAASP